MKRTIGLLASIVLLLAAPASAHASVASTTASIARPAAAAATTSGETSGSGGTVPLTRAYPNDKGADGTDMATFFALFLGGAALVAAMTALIMGRRRIPS